MLNDNQHTILGGFTSAGPVNAGPAMKLPKQKVKKHQFNPLEVLPHCVPIIPTVNSNDFNNYHDTEGFDEKAIGLFDSSAFSGEVSEGLYQKFLKHEIAGIPTKVMQNRYEHKQDVSFTGYNSVDYLGLSTDEQNDYIKFLQDLSPAEMQEYSDFLGINFKKVGKALGNAAKGVGHAVGSVGKDIGHVIGAGAKDVAKGAATVGKAVGKTAAVAGKAVGKGAATVGKTYWNVEKKVFTTIEHNAETVGKTAINNWPIVAGLAAGILTANPAIGMAVYAAGEKLKDGTDTDSLTPTYGGAGSGDFGGDGSDIDSTTSEDVDPDDLQDTDGSNTPDGQNTDAGTPAGSPAPAGLLQNLAKYKVIAGVIGALILAYFIFKHKK